MEMTKIKKQKMVIVIVLIFVLIIFMVAILNRQGTTQIEIQSEVGEQNMETILKGSHQIGVVSFNLDTRCTNGGRGQSDGCGGSLKESIQASLNEGKSWEIIGFQEMDEPHSKDQKPKTYSDSQDFIQIMQSLGQGTYQCEKQREFSNDFYSVICSKYPIVPNSYREHVIWRSDSGTGQARIIQCVQVQHPAGILVVCNTHPRAYLGSDGSPMVNQFRELERMILGEFLTSYIPGTVLPEYKSTYLASLRARVILTGDMNIDAHRIVGRFVSACIGKWQGRDIPKGTGCGIDQVMYLNMTHPEFAHQASFNTQYLFSEGGYKDTTRQWPTDHDGPVVSIFSTKELKVPLKFVNDTLTPTQKVISPIPSISASISQPTATPSRSVVSNQPNLLDGKPVIRIVNFNPGPGHSGNQPRTSAWTDLVGYLKNNNVEIVLIQEPGAAELAKIRELFEPVFPYSRWIRYPEGISDPKEIKRGGELNPIFSKYPFVEGTQQEWKISPDDKERDKNRVVLSVEIQIPYGILRTVNMHTHGDTQCADAYKALEPIVNPASPYYNPPSKNFIITGDFNIALDQIAPKYDPAVRNSGAILDGNYCDNSKYSNQYIDKKVLADLIRPNYKALCVDPNICRNKATIEMVLTLNNNPIEIYKTWWGDERFRNIFADANRHPVVFAEIGDPKWILPVISPKPSSVIPTIQTNPQDNGVMIDLNEDGKLDITDFALFVEYYKVGNVKIDYDSDGKTQRDIEDFNFFVTKYKLGLE